ncbi:PilZ domain-containing protein [Xaviernesmea oryzae]|nr:PilZ domain-containing protein [Xaviernesmea oryzae]SEL71413.1 PilZ domain-containing protein [Xaviernesmea oryzae]
MRSLHNRRLAPRSGVNIEGQLRTRQDKTRCTLLNLSDSGVCVRLRANIGASQGASVTVDTEAVGVLEGIVQWTRGDLAGLRFDRSSNATAKISSYFRLFRR